MIAKPGASLSEKDVAAALKKAGFGVSKFAEAKPAKKGKKDKKKKDGKGGGAVLVSITGMT